MKEFKRYLVTSALPYANGPVHLGHLAGVYIPSDIYVRYLRLRHRDVVWVCGSDEHGVPITLKAKKEGVSPQQVVDKYHNIIKTSFAEFGISFDIYSRTSNKVHHETSSGMFKHIYDQNGFIEETTEQFYDDEAKQFLADRYIVGGCPKCDNENAYGDQCEKCGSTLSPNELRNPKSAISGSVPIKKSTKHWFLPLDKWENWLKEWILEGHKEWKPNVYGACKSWIDGGLNPRAVSRDLDWGVPLPIPGTEGKVLYVWFDAPIGYISATKELRPNDWEKYWKDKDTKLVHFIGKDNIVFHCIIFPVMLKSSGFILPENVPSNEFLNLEGDKISTSRNWAVWLHEYLEDFKGKQDVLRYVLTANAPETKDNDFTWKDFQARNNNELVAILGNFVNRCIVLTHKYFEGKVPQLNTLTDYDKQVLAEIPKLRKNIENQIENYHFRDAQKDLMNLARLGNKYLADTEPWNTIKTDENRVKTVLNISLQIIANLSILGEPFLPFTSAKLLEFLNMPKTDWESAGKSDILPTGHLINKAGLLYEKIEDEVIEKQLDKLKSTKPMETKENEIDTEKKVIVSPQKPNIAFDDFAKMDIRIGTILEAERVPKTDKLLKLLIDTGIDKRTVVSGIAEHYKPEECIGKQVTLLANLEPRKLKNIDSQGMILLAENSEGKLVFVSPILPVNNGSVVR